MSDAHTHSVTAPHGQDAGIPVVSPETVSSIDLHALKAEIIECAHELGFDLVKFARVGAMPETQAVLEERIDAGLLSGLTWFTKERARVASDPRNLMAAARTAVSLGISYLGSGDYTPSTPGEPRGKVARYAWGLDYHEVFKGKLVALHEFVQARLGREVEARTLVDTARIVDRAVAESAGVGWFGKNSNILNRERGSWILLGELLLDIELPSDERVKTHCGSCTHCMPSCSTGAILAPGVIDSDRCISYLTIELRGPIPREMRPLIGDWVFGCDICQEVCPVNRKAVQGDHAEFAPESGIGASPVLTELLDMTEDEFRARFKYSPVKRAKWAGLRRNAAVALGNVGDPEGVPALVRALSGTSALVRGHAAWALGRIGGEAALVALREQMDIEDDEWVRDEIGLALDVSHRS
jgi:epoxyqueuosine reductase